jgi:hypothetical protein
VSKAPARHAPRNSSWLLIFTTPFSPVSTSFHTFTLLPDLRKRDTVGTRNKPASDDLA